MKISVVVVTYRRLSSLDRILGAWLDQTDEVFLADCSGGKFYTSLPVTHVRFSRDLGSKTRHALALLTEGDCVIKADDDVLPLPGLAKDFMEASKSHEGILGLIGRKFNGESYYGNTRFYRANQLEAPKRVDFVGVVTFAPRACLPFDLKGCLTPIEDIFWQMKAFPHAPKWVIATKNYRNLPESSDEACLFHSDKAREVREGFYREYYLKNYANRA